MSLRHTVTAKLSAPHRVALAAVEQAQASSVSELVRRALLETYHLDEIADRMLLAGMSLLVTADRSQAGGEEDNAAKQ